MMRCYSVYSLNVVSLFMYFSRDFGRMMCCLFFSLRYMTRLELPIVVVYCCHLLGPLPHAHALPLLTASGEKTRGKRPPEQAPGGPGSGGGDEKLPCHVRGARCLVGDGQGTAGGGGLRTDQAASGRQQVGERGVGCVKNFFFYLPR